MNIKDIVVPELDGDKLIFKDRSMPERCRIERLTVYALLLHLQASGFEPVSVYDGEVMEKTPTLKEAMEVIFSVDEAGLYVKKEGFKRRWIGIVFGNGHECIADYVVETDDGFEAVMDAFDSDQFATNIPQTTLIHLTPGETPKF